MKLKALVKFHKPADEEDVRRSCSNIPGMRHMVFAVEDIETAASALEDKGWNLTEKFKIMKTLINLVILKNLKILS